MGRARLAFGAVLAAALIVLGWQSLGAPDVPSVTRDVSPAEAGGGGPGASLSLGDDERAARLAARPEEPPPASSPAVEPPGFRLLGRVLDPQRKGVPGAEVVFHGAGAGAWRAVTDGKGAFGVRLGSLENRTPWLDDLLGLDGAASFTASKPGVGAAVEPVLLDRQDFLAGDQATLPALILGSAEAFEVKVLGDGRPVEGAHVRLDVGFGRLLAASGMSGPDGIFRVPSLPAGSVRAVVTWGGRYGAKTLALGERQAGARQLTVQLDPLRTVTIEVVDSLPPYAPIPGARVWIMEQVLPDARRASGSSSSLAMTVPRKRALRSQPSITGEDGVALVQGLPQVPLTVEARLPIPGVPMNSPDRAFQGSSTLAGSASQTRVELERAHLCHGAVWPIKRATGEASSVAPPAEGTALRILPLNYGGPMGFGPRGARVQGGAIRTEDWLPRRFAGLALASDGSVAELEMSAVEPTGMGTFFRARKRIELRLREPTGAPAAGWRVAAYDSNQRRIGSAQITDSRGEATFGALLGGTVEVCALDGADAFGLVSIAKVDLGATAVLDGTFVVEAVIPLAGLVTLELSLDGEKRLPDGFEVWNGEVVSEAPDAGRAEIRVLLGAGQGHASLWVSGGAYWIKAKVQLSREALRSGDVVLVELQPAGRVLGEVLRRPGTEVLIYLERMGEDGEWSGDQYSANSCPNTDGGEFGFDSQLPGTYRIRDGVSEETSEPVVLRFPGDTVGALLDLRGLPQDPEDSGD